MKMRRDDETIDLFANDEASDALKCSVKVFPHVLSLCFILVLI